MRWTLGIEDLRELLADIDRELANAKKQGASGFSTEHRNSVTKGWNAALDAVRSQLVNNVEPCSSIRDALGVVDRLRDGKAAPLMRKMREAQGAKAEPELTPELRQQAEATLQVYTDYGRRIRELEERVALTVQVKVAADGRMSKLEAENRELRALWSENEARLAKTAQHVQKLAAEIGSLQKDRYEYATLTARVHELERWQHAGETPRHEKRGNY